MRYEFRPLAYWPQEPTDPHPPCRFKAPWDATLKLLGRETEMLGADLVVIQVDVTQAQIRRDGMLRADTRPYNPGVRIAFDSRHGSLTYSTDQYADWRDNVRAIALSLEALRAVDRYGVSRRGEQYRGWTAITAGASGGRQTLTPAQAVAILGEHHEGDWQQLLIDRQAVSSAFRRGARQHHENAEQLARLQAARDTLYQHIGGDRG